MNANLQTLAALTVVALAALGLVWRAWSRRKSGGCTDEGCGAVSPQARAFRRRLGRR